MAINVSPTVPVDGLVLCLDASNRRSYNSNRHPYPTDLYSWTTSASAGGVLSRDNISSPVGSTPMKMVISANDTYTATYNSNTWNISPASNGQVWTASVYAKADRTVTGQIWLFTANSTGGYTQAPYNAATLTTDWQRITVSTTISDVNAAYVQVRLNGPPASAVSGTTIWWDGLQVEQTPSATPFKASLGSNNVLDMTTTGLHHRRVSNSVFGYANGVLAFDCRLNANMVPVSNTAPLQLGSSHTLVAWGNMSPDSAVDTWRTLWRTQPNDHPLLVQDGTGAVGYYDNDGGGGFQTYGLNAATLGLENTWTMYTLVASGGSTTCYINDTGSSGTVAYSASGLYHDSIGGANGSQPFGYIAYAAVYNRALSVGEIRQMYNAMKGRFGK